MTRSAVSSRRATEADVRACYASWPASYHDQYYGPDSTYPPVHRDLVRQQLVDAGAKTLLDAGCGPASFLRELTDLDLEPYGFDLTPEMVEEANRVLVRLGCGEGRVWRGSVCDAAAFRDPRGAAPDRFEAVVCIGVLPHVREEDEPAIFANLRAATEPGGLVVIEARNQLFSLFTLNRCTHEFLADELVREKELIRAGGKAEPVTRALEALRSQLRMDLPPRRPGEDGAPGYDEVLCRAHNPLVLPHRFAEAGFRDVQVLFYHFHCLPPSCESIDPRWFRAQSLAREEATDWRGHFMASAFLVCGRAS